MIKRAVFASSLFIFTTISIASAADQKNDPKDVKVEEAFEDASGRLFVRFKYHSTYGSSKERNPDFFGTQLSFAGDSKGLYQLHETGSSSGGGQLKIGFEDARVKGKDGEKGGVFYAGVDENGKKTTENKVVCGDPAKSSQYKTLSSEQIAKLEESIRSSKLSLNGLPNSVRDPEYLFKQADGTIIYVDSSRYSYSYGSFRLFVGKPGSMKEKKVKNVTRMRDGGTTVVETVDGEKLFSPSALRPNSGPNWNGIAIERVDAKGFSLESLGIEGVPTSEVSLRTPCDRYFPAQAKDKSKSTSSSKGMN